MNPIDFEEAYTSIILGGVKSPGVVTLTGHDRKVEWDVKNGNGQSGASTTLKSIPPVEFTATFYLADADDIDAWPAFHGLINSTLSGRTPKALDIYHPDLVENEIVSVVKALVGGAVHDKKGGQTRVVKFQEYKPPKPKGGSPAGSSTSAKAKDPNQAALDELAKLTDQFNKTPWGDGRGAALGENGAASAGGG